jgi:hypothetical protein
VDGSKSPPNPRRAAGRLNRQKRRGLTPEGRERLRQAALAGRPWLHATGPKTAAGKARAAENGKRGQGNSPPAREVRRQLAALTGLAADMAALRQAAQRPRRPADA